MKTYENMKKRWFIFLIFISIICGFIFPFKFLKAQNSLVCGIYFTGIGCSHCAKSDPFILEKWLKEYPNFIVIEYEIFQEKWNAPLIYQYHEKYNSGLGIPLLIFNQKQTFIGDSSILKNTEETLKNLQSNPCSLIDGSGVDFNNLDLGSLPGSPKIWYQEKILVKEGQKGDSQLFKKLLLQDNLEEILKNINFQKIEPKKIFLSGGFRQFDYAIKLDDWIFQWRGEKLEGLITNKKIIPDISLSPVQPQLTLAKVFSLAFADSINPCAFAVLILMLIAILTYDPTKRKNILLAGFYFISAIFVTYLFYGIVIIRFFQIIQTLSSFRPILYKIFGGLAIILGILNIKDFIKYQPGGFLTEMPLFLRPRVKKLILGITSPKGAFFTGIFVTLFLLPCTIGPYIICGGILCTLDFFKALPYLIFYNFVFVLPMIVIVLLIYKGFAKIEDISGWKDRNIRYLHLIAGLIIFFLGVVMLFGFI